MRLIEAAEQRDKGLSILRWTHYFEAYDFHFASLQNNSVRVLEIGIMDGGSLWMWKKYFPESVIVGIDCDETCLQWGDADRLVYAHKGDQADGNFLQYIDRLHGPFDIVVDDGSHKMRDQQFTFNALFPLIKDGGIYVIEDLHTSFWPPWQDGTEPTVDALLGQARQLQGWAMRSHEAMGLKENSTADYMEQNISSMHFYDSICFIYKNGYGKNVFGEGGMYHG